MLGGNNGNEKGTWVSNVRESTVLNNQSSGGAKHPQVAPWKALFTSSRILPSISAISEMMPFYHISFCKGGTGWLGLVIIHMCQFRLEKNSFKAIRLAPTKFSGRFSVSK